MYNEVTVYTQLATKKHQGQDEQTHEVEHIKVASDAGSVVGKASQCGSRPQTGPTHEQSFAFQSPPGAAPSFDQSQADSSSRVRGKGKRNS